MSNLVVLGDEWSALKEQATVLLKSGFLPTSIKTPEQAIAIMLKGRELKLAPWVSLTHIHVINGKPCMSAELMKSQIHRNSPGSIVDFLEMTNQICTIEAARPNGRMTKFSFSIEDAKKAGLLTKAVWQQYPRAMLRSRCVAEMARSLFPDALQGISYTPEELGASVTEDGDVIETDAVPETEAAQETKKKAPYLNTILRNAERKPFDSGDPVHLLSLNKQFDLRGITDPVARSTLTVLMAGRFSSDLDEIIETYLEGRETASKKNL